MAATAGSRCAWTVVALTIVVVADLSAAREGPEAPGSGPRRSSTRCSGAPGDAFRRLGEPAPRRRCRGARSPSRGGRGALGGRDRCRVDRRARGVCCPSASPPSSPAPDRRRPATRADGAKARVPGRRGRARRSSSADASLDRGPSCDADAVVVLTDGYPSGLLGELEGLIVPTRGQVIASEPLAGEALQCSTLRAPRLRLLAPDRGRAHCRLLAAFGTCRSKREFTAGEGPTTDWVQLGRSRGFVNGLVGRELRVDYRWAGIFGLVLDFLPVVGKVPGEAGMWVAGGYSGHGNVLGFAWERLVGAGDPRRSRPTAQALRAARLLGQSPCNALILGQGQGRYLEIDMLRWSDPRSSVAASIERSWAAFAIARSWTARPVESNRVTSSALLRPSASPTRTRPISVTSPRVTRPAGNYPPRAHRRGARLLPVVAEEASARELLDRHLGLAGTVCAHQARCAGRCGADRERIRRWPGGVTVITSRSCSSPSRDPAMRCAEPDRRRPAAGRCRRPRRAG